MFETTNQCLFSVSKRKWPQIGHIPPTFGYKPLSQSDTSPARSCYIPINKNHKNCFCLKLNPMKAQENPMKSACSIHFHLFSMIGRNPNCGLAGSLGPWEPWSDLNPEDLDPVPRGWCTSHPGGRKSNPETWPGGSYGWFNGLSICLSLGQIMILSWEKAKNNATRMGVFTNTTGDLSDWMGWVLGNGE